MVPKPSESKNTRLRRETHRGRCRRCANRAPIRQWHHAFGPDNPPDPQCPLPPPPPPNLSFVRRRFPARSTPLNACSSVNSQAPTRSADRAVSFLRQFAVSRNFSIMSVDCSWFLGFFSAAVPAVFESACVGFKSDSVLIIFFPPSFGCVHALWIKLCGCVEDSVSWSPDRESWTFRLPVRVIFVWLDFRLSPFFSFWFLNNSAYLYETNVSSIEKIN